MITKNAVWLITGCSKGLGRALAEQVLAAGYRVVVTARRTTGIADLVAAHGDAALAVELDVTNSAQIATAVTAGEQLFGGIDVLVNNAGYGYLAAIEEGEDADVRALFETDLFGPVNLIKAALPGMRARRRGHIVNISSIGGLVTYPGVGYYHMVKFGIEAMSETLAKEVAPLGIDVTVVAPGAFRTDFRGPASIRQSTTRIDDYADTAGKSREGTHAGHGKQAGDPARGARAIIAAVEAERPPVHMLIGGDALDQLRGKLEAMRRETDAWEEVTRSTEFGLGLNQPPTPRVTLHRSLAFSNGRTTSSPAC
jgi:NAD(P)-dependent dehydrogenase (short-subunit alcohol dehydrogenase family)